MWTVIRSSKTYGYALYWTGDALAYLNGGHRMGWYRYKRDATKRAAELNKEG